VLIAAITIAARAIGFAKQLVFARTVGTDCLSTSYFTANHVPNLVFEVVVGGALAGMVVPVLAGAAARSLEGREGAPGGEDGSRGGGTAARERPDGPRLAGPGDGRPGETAAGTDGNGGEEDAYTPKEAKARVAWITSALLTWVVAVLVPLGALTALAAEPLIGFFIGDDLRRCDTAEVTAVATRMLVVFAPQVPLYGLAVVLYGVLQAHRRFAGPALAPLVSSLVVIAAYLTFVPLSGGVVDPGTLPAPAEAALSVGTTLGVLALVVTVVGPFSRLRLRLRPTFRFPPGVAARVRRLALAGLAALLAQQAAQALTVVLANHRVGGGAIAAYNYAWAIYLVPYAVLAVPIATSAFPLLSTHAERGDSEAFASVGARTGRAVVLVSGLAAGVLAAVATPVAAVFVEGTASTVDPAELARAIALFAPGLVGYGLIAHLSRVLYAAGHGRAAAAGTVVGWLAMMAAQALMVLVLPAPWRLGGLAAGCAIGMTVGGAALAAAVARARGAATLHGMGRACAAALLGGVLGWLAGGGVVAWVAAEGVWGSALAAVPAAVVALAAGLAAMAAVDRRDAAAVLARFTRRAVPADKTAEREGSGHGGTGR